MSAEDRKSKQLDDFWDISELVPRKSRSFGVARSVDAVEVRVPAKPQPQESGSEGDSVIKRYIPPHSEERLTAAQLEECGSYCPTDSLIHQVSLKKWKCSYHYYNEFLRDATRYREVRGEACEYVPFFSYVPQYNQLNSKQLAYYFWFRENARADRFIQADYSYVLLYIYELLNLGEALDVRESQHRLMSLWNAYHETFPAISGKLADWICDFSLIHRLSPPENTGVAIIQKVMALKEFYIAMPKHDIEGGARVLLRFCCSYDFHTSKFAKEHEALFEKHIFEAVVEAVRYYSADGRLLSRLTFDDCRIVRDAYAGALCVAQQKYRIEVEYCSFSRSNELRFLVGDIVKYAENKLRAYLGIKSKMTVYAVPTDLKAVLDAYFARALPGKRAARPTQKPQAYEALYDLPQKPFSLQDAARIEAESWDTARDLIEAFEEELQEEPQTVAEPEVVSEETTEAEQTDLMTRLGVWRAVIYRLLSGETCAIADAARQAEKMPESLADEINALAFDAIGDVLIEETDEGYQVIEDYRSLLE